MRDQHTHCPCNGVLLCETCHDWVHAHPFEARGFGLIVSRSETQPGQVPVTAYYGTLLLECDGKFAYQHNFSDEEVR